jgi:hypothetical protein
MQLGVGEVVDQGGAAAAGLEKWFQHFLLEEEGWRKKKNICSELA